MLVYAYMIPNRCVFRDYSRAFWQYGVCLKMRTRSVNKCNTGKLILNILLKNVYSFNLQYSSRSNIKFALKHFHFIDIFYRNITFQSFGEEPLYPGKFLSKWKMFANSLSTVRAPATSGALLPASR